MNLRTAQSIFSAAFCTLLAIIIFPADSISQGRYAERYSRADVNGIIKRLENSSDVFRKDFDKEMDRSALNGTSTEDRYNREVRQYENSLDALRKKFDKDDTWWETRSEVSKVVNEAQSVNSIMKSITFRRNLERQWNSMRRDLNTLADTYDLPGLDGGGYQGGGGGGFPGGGSPGGSTITPPVWAQGTFFGRAANGTPITLTIARNGSVNADINGTLTYGTFTRGNYLSIGGAYARVTQQRSGILTVRTDNNERIAYTRRSYDGGIGSDGAAGTPPGWAVGTFTGRAANGTQIRLTIAKNGSVTARIGGSTIRGTYFQGAITIDGAVSRVAKAGTGIRTTRDDTGESIVYRRR